MSRHFSILFAIVAFLSTGMTSAHAMYNSDRGRWLTRDPARYADGCNLFAYARSGPLLFVDPSGLKRHIFAFEGLQASDINSNWSHNEALQTWWKPIALELGAEWHYYTQEEVDRAVNEAYGIATAPESSGMCAIHFHTIIAAGYSMGGHSAIQFARKLKELDVMVDLGFTADPVPNTELGLLVGFFGHPNFSKPENVTYWVNWFQRVDDSTIIPVFGIDGNPIAGAVNLELGQGAFTSFGFNWHTAHVWIVQHPWVLRESTYSFHDSVENVPEWRPFWRW